MAKVKVERRRENGEWRYVITVTEWADGGEECMFEEDIVRLAKKYGDMGLEIDEDLEREVEKYKDGV